MSHLNILTEGRAVGSVRKRSGPEWGCEEAERGELKSGLRRWEFISTKKIVHL